MVHRETKEALRTIGKFLKDEAGSSWLASISTGRTQPINAEQLMRQLINSTDIDNAVKRAAEIVIAVFEEQRLTGKKDDSLILEPEGWKELVEKVEERDDIICIYKKISNATQPSNDWEKLLTSVTFDYVIQLALEIGQKYVLCLKKIDKSDITTLMSAEQIEMTTSMPETTDTTLENKTSVTSSGDRLDEVNIGENKIDLPREEARGDEGITESQTPISNTDSRNCIGKSSQSISLQSRDLYVEHNDDGNDMNILMPTQKISPPLSLQLRQWPSWDMSKRKSMNSDRIKLPFNQAHEQLKFSHKSQILSVDLPSDTNINNNSPASSLNLRPESSLYQTDGNDFMNNLVPIHAYPLNHNFYPLVYQKYYQERFYPILDSQPSENLVKPRALVNYENSEKPIYRAGLRGINDDKNIQVEKDNSAHEKYIINDALNVVIPLNNSPKELITVSIHTDTEGDIPVKRNKKVSKKVPKKEGRKKKTSKNKSRKNIIKNNRPSGNIGRISK
uniref:Uncharacterized protein n=1 Tax=Bracon brevicornis TaxID=1563983 RepID=A0A6V7ID65_9HYME